MKVLFLLRSLNVGGAERQLVLLAKGLHQRGHDVVVCVFYGGGALEQELRNSGVKLRSIDKRGRWDVLAFFRRLKSVVREEQPDILHSYLPDPNLVSVALKPFFPGLRVVWGVRASRMDLDRYGWLDRVNFFLTCRLSRWADLIIANSECGRRYHVERGYPAATTLTIRNGIDTHRFCPDPEGRARVRAEWGVRDDEALIGMVGRLDLMKDHPVFLEAASLLAQRRPNVKFVCIGGGDGPYRQYLIERTSALGLGQRLRWEGVRADMTAVYNALDVKVSTSYGEGLSNVLAEAMACGVQVVATDVGDAAWMLGTLGRIVPPKSPEALARTLDQVLEKPTSHPARIRQHIIDRLSVNALVHATERVFMELLAPPASVRIAENHQLS